MNFDHTANRITDLLRLAGFRDKNTVEELTDHYLSHIEEEVHRGVNPQQATRETFQEIANLDYNQFRIKKSNLPLRWRLLILLLGVLFSIYFITTSKLNTTETHNTLQIEEIVKNEPPNGFPILQDSLDVTSEFGMRMHPYLRKRSHHRGIDIRAKKGTPVVATGEGTVVETGYSEKPGNYIVIQHEEGYTTKFYHLSEVMVTKDEIVKKNQVIGKVGSSGLSIKPHLHYEILIDEVPVNPRTYLKP